MDTSHRPARPHTAARHMFWVLEVSLNLRSGFTSAPLPGQRGVMDPIVEVVALVLGFIGWVMVGVALPNRYWRTSTIDGTVITTSTLYENLWMSCATDSTGVHNCREFPSMLALSGMLTRNRVITFNSGITIQTRRFQFFYEVQDKMCMLKEYFNSFCWRWLALFVATLSAGYIQASRALMITSVALGTFGLVAALIGLKCSKAGGDNYVLKGRIAGTAGVLFLLQGSSRPV